MSQMTDECLAFTIYSDSTHEMVTFAHPEATQAIHDLSTGAKGKRRILETGIKFYQKTLSDII